MPKPAHPPATVARVRELLAAGISPGAAAETAAAEGHTISRASARMIKNGTYRQPKAAADLAPGETRLESPTRCPQGHLITVWPCRSCAILAPLEAIQAAGRAAAANPSPQGPRRRRGPYRRKTA